MAGKIKINYIKFFIFIISTFIIIFLGKDVFNRRFFNEQKAEVPNVLNLDREEAVKYLKDANLKVKIESEDSKKVGFDKVFIQYPEPGKIVKVHRTITIWVNNGKGRVVPDLVKLDLIAAKSKIQNSDIQIEKIDYIPSDEKFNTVLSVYPAPGTKLDPSQKISLLVSSRKILDASVMPNVIGLELKDAQALLTQLGLKVGNVTKANDDALPVNSIISTSPEPGAKIEKGMVVSIVISAGPTKKSEEPSIEEIIRENQGENVTNQNVEDIINQTLEKIDEKKDQPKNDNSQGTKPDNGTAPKNTTDQPSQPKPQPKPNNGDSQPAQN